METQCQHLTMTQRNEFLKLLQKFEELLDGTLGTWKTDPVDFELKEDMNPTCGQPYPVPKVQGGVPPKKSEKVFFESKLSFFVVSC